MLTLALPGGRVMKESVELLRRGGIDITEVLDGGRRLLFELPGAGMRVLLLKPFDVPVYVEKGAADIGVAGLDVIREHDLDIFTLADLGIGVCRMAVAGPKGVVRASASKLRVGTKFPRIARTYFERTGRQIELVKLYGSIELAPLTGVADCIVDIVSTGETLRKNGLAVTEEIMHVSSYLIANRIAFKTKFAELSIVLDRLAGVTGQVP